MDFGQQRLQQQDAARQMMYQNSGYQFERRDKKTLIVDVADVSNTNAPLSKAEEFSLDLFEPLTIDKLSDVYLDSFMTHNSLICHTGDTMAFVLKINEFNINSNVASTSSNKHIFNSIIIPNDHDSIDNVHSCVIHKGKKLNYVCSINPCKLSKISGKITDLAGNSAFNGQQAGSSVLASINIHSIELEDSLSHGLYGLHGLGTLIGINGVAASVWNAKMVAASSKGATTIYFIILVDTASQDLYTSSLEFEFYTNAGSDVRDTQIGSDHTTIAATHREGDKSRFIAEFVIVARE